LPIVKPPSWDDVQNKPSTFPPDTHASDHASGGSDEITPADIGAAAASHASQHAAGGSDPITPADIEAVAQAADYDSGWFSVTTDTVYTLDHNLNKLPSFCLLFCRENDAYSFYSIFPIAATRTDNGWTGCSLAVSSSQIKIYACSASINIPWTWKVGATSSDITSGEYRVLAWK